MPTITPERFAKIVEGVLADRLKPPPRLYHYTSQEGLLGILSSKTLWATRIQYLNDSTEFSYTLALLKKAFDLHVVGQLWAKVITHSPLRALDHLRSHPIHVACFSEKQDDLSQWRGYCPGGGGFSVGFDSDQLGKAADSRHAFIAPCVYDPDLQSHLVKQLVDGFIKEGFTERDKDFDAKKVSWDFTMDCIFLACVLKHPSFKDEQEWRIVSQSIPPTDPQLGFRKSRTALIPHLRFELTEPQVPLNVHLVVGPNPEMELALESATSLFAATNCTGPAVSTSVVPYRQL